MTEPVLVLDDLERDALTELVNIGVGRAATNLRKMIGQEILLSVPAVEVVTTRSAAALIGEREAGALVAVRQSFTGAFSGRAMLIFPEANSLDLVRAVTGGELGPEEVGEIEQEALAETGNVVLNSCLATMANLLKRPLTVSLPEVVREEGACLFADDTASSFDGAVLFLYINFAVRGRNIRGYIAMLMDMPSLEALRTLIQDFIHQVVGPGSDDLFA